MNSSFVLRRYQQLYDDLASLSSGEEPFVLSNCVFEIFLPEYLIYHLRTFNGTNSIEQKLNPYIVFKSFLSYFIKPFFRQSLIGTHRISKYLLISPFYLLEQFHKLLQSCNLSNISDLSIIKIMPNNTVSICDSPPLKLSTVCTYFVDFPKLYNLYRFINSPRSHSSLHLIDQFVHKIYPEKYNYHKFLSRFYFASRLLSFSNHPFIISLHENPSYFHNLFTCDPASPFTRFLITALSRKSSINISIFEIGLISPHSTPHEYVFSSAITKKITYYTQSLSLPFKNHSVSLDAFVQQSQTALKINPLPLSKLLDHRFHHDKILFFGTNLSNSNPVFALTVLSKYLLILFTLIKNTDASCKIYIKPHPLATLLDRSLLHLFAFFFLRAVYVHHQASLEIFLAQNPDFYAVISCDSTASRHHTLNNCVQYYY
jgi:hypothetical protein